ncbi:hypothetical protein TNCT_470361 [Trichonephila clavata]|uniref:Uncharacterized protein n=1 Tax=Trichonephila clavata TaxID=2740835 RepID=A0A8X6JYA1_TRICU|nr:hypothetical protein TNCT_470361 [Trichonephila clavata]
MDCPSDSHDLVSISTTCYSLPIAIIHLTVSRILYRDLYPSLKCSIKRYVHRETHDPEWRCHPLARNGTICHALKCGQDHQSLGTTVPSHLSLSVNFSFLRHSRRFFEAVKVNNGRREGLE